MERAEVAEKGMAYFEVAPKIEPEPRYKNLKLSSVDTRTVNRILTTQQTGWQKWE
jgi:hypothetical protein